MSIDRSKLQKAFPEVSLDALALLAEYLDSQLKGRSNNEIHPNFL